MLESLFSVKYPRVESLRGQNFRLCKGSNPTRGVLEVCDGDTFRHLFWLAMKLLSVSRVSYLMKAIRYHHHHHHHHHHQKINKKKHYLVKNLLLKADCFKKIITSPPPYPPPHQNYFGVREKKLTMHKFVLHHTKISIHTLLVVTCSRTSSGRIERKSQLHFLLILLSHFNDI